MSLTSRGYSSIPFPERDDRLRNLQRLENVQKYLSNNDEAAAKAIVDEAMGKD